MFTPKQKGIALATVCALAIGAVQFAGATTLDASTTEALTAGVTSAKTGMGEVIGAVFAGLVGLTIIVGAINWTLGRIRRPFGRG